MREMVSIVVEEIRRCYVLQGSGSIRLLKNAIYDVLL